MPGEYDPAEELGLFPDRMFFTNLSGFVLGNNTLRDACARFIRNGAHFYDVIKRYDALTAYVLGREEAIAGNTVKWIMPFLKANGATDYTLEQCFAENMKVMSGAPEALRFISRLMPTYVSTSMFNHGWLPLEEQLDAPLCNVLTSKAELDMSQFGRIDSRKIREMCEEITSLKIPKIEYELNVPMEVHEADVKIIKTLDDILQNRLYNTPALSLMENVDAVTSHRKAYWLLDIRRQTNIDLDFTMYVGGEDTDYQCLDLVRDDSGLAVSFNGTEFATRGCNVAVMSKDSTVCTVLASLFYDRGPEAVRDLANNWSRDYLKKCDFTDRTLLDRMLQLNPRRLPEVYYVDDDNVEEISAKSAEYRKKLIGS